MKRVADTHTCALYASPGTACNVGEASCRAADELFVLRDAVTAPSVLLVDVGLVGRMAEIEAMPEHVVLVAGDEDAAKALGRRAELSLVGITEATARRALLDAACRLAIEQCAIARFEDEFHEVSRIGIDLMREHDRKKLLRLIVTQSKRLTFSDGGGLLLTRKDEAGRDWLRPVLYAFDSIDGEFIAPESEYPVDEASIVGHAAVVKRPVVIDDVYDLPHDERFHRAMEFDRKYRYRRRSMLAVPMLDQLNRVLGVLVCINRKRDPAAKICTKEDADRYVIGYSGREVRLVRMLASQAAVAIENARLYAQVEYAFESFAQAAVSAIDLRDPATAGHSMRVADLATALAEDLERSESGPYRNVRFTAAQLRELRFAALLHDIGKVAVPEAVLLKAKKLPNGGWERIDARFDLIRRTLELASCRACASDGSSRVSDTDRDICMSDDALAARLADLERCREIVRKANEPMTLGEHAAAELKSIAAQHYERPDGSTAPYLTPDELHYLLLPKGTLDDRERVKIESHVIATRDLLARIPWPEDLEDIVRYAYEHHELLDGSGYPQHLVGEEIPLQTRIITIADIFDALTARDRPYKPATPVEQALEMLRADAAAGLLDPELVKVLAESESYRRSDTDEAEL